MRSSSNARLKESEEETRGGEAREVGGSRHAGEGASPAEDLFEESVMFEPGWARQGTHDDGENGANGKLDKEVGTEGLGTCGEMLAR